MYCIQCFLKSKYIKSRTFNDKNRWIIKKVMVFKKLLQHLATRGTYSPGDWRCDEAWCEQTLVYPPVMCQQRLIYCTWELNIMKGPMWCPWCQVSVVVKLRVFRLCLCCHRSNGLWHGHFGAATARVGPFGPQVLLPIMEHSRANAGLVHLATYPGWEVSGGLDRQEFPELSPGHTASGSNATIGPSLAHDRRPSQVLQRQSRVALYFSCSWRTMKIASTPNPRL